MARKIRAKLILQLHESSMSQNEIARSQGMSKHSVSDVVHRALTLILAGAMSHPRANKKFTRCSFQKD